MKAVARSLARRLAFAVLGSDPALGVKLRAIASAEALTILNFHRVNDNRTSADEAIPPKLFDKLVAWLATRFRIVTFAELTEMKSDGKPPLILSFDDGYRDFVEVVMPILARHKVRVNQNVIPAAVASGKPPINVILQDFIGQAPASLLREIAFPGITGAVDPDDRIRAGLKVSAAIKNRPIREQKALLAALEPQMARYDGFRTTPMMTLEDLKSAADTHEIGAHSYEHASMAMETDQYLADDARNCALWLHQTLGLAPAIYAFPNGSHRAGQAEIVQSTGFRHVLLVRGEFSRPSEWCHPRFGLYGNTCSELKFRAVGGMAAVRAAVKTLEGRGQDNERR